MSDSSTKSAVFVVGVPRSGTTLLAAFLGSHSRFSCGTETDFFHFLAQVDERVLLAKETWPEAAVDFLFRQVPGAGRAAVPYEYGLTREDVFSYLAHRPPSIGNILGAIVEQYMWRAGKGRWVEKTPNHLLYVERIRSVFPDAKIIRIVRDPRDAALSILKAPWPWAPRTLAGALSMWRYMDSASDSFFASDGNSCTIKYEDLVSDATLTLARVCDFLGEKFERQMLEKKHSYRRVNRLGEPWKSKVSESADRSRIGVWEREMGDREKALSESLIGDRLSQFGYLRRPRSLGLACIFPIDASLRYPEVSAWLSRENLRAWSLTDSEAPVAYLFVGDPEHDRWFGHNLKARVGSFLTICSFLFSATRNGAASVWLRPRSLGASGILGQSAICLIRRVSRVIILAADCQSDSSWRINLVRNPRLAPPMAIGSGMDHLNCQE